MKKLLVFLVMMSLMIVPMVMGDVSQPVNVNVIGTLTVDITPDTLDFGSVSPGTNNAPSTENIVLDASGSTESITVTVTNVIGEPFASGLKFGGNPALDQKFNMICTAIGSVCAFDTQTIISTLDIPMGISSGIKPGTITYTITGITP